MGTHCAQPCAGASTVVLGLKALLLTSLILVERDPQDAPRLPCLLPLLSGTFPHPYPCSFILQAFIKCHRLPKLSLHRRIYSWSPM